MEPGLSPDAFVIDAFRPQDLLALRFELFNLSPSADGRFVRADRAAPALIIVRFPPQHLAESAFPFALVGSGSLPDPPVATRLAAGSRLVFRLPADRESLPMTLEALLDWREWELVVAPRALPDGADAPRDQPAPTPPDGGETAIEFPLRLLLSPTASARWRHDALPVLRQGAHEVWRTHLAHTQGEGVAGRLLDGGTVRALFAASGPGAGDTGVSERDRHEIVQLSSNYGIVLGSGAGAPRYRPRPMRAEQLSLSTLGATARMVGTWDFPLLPPTEGVEAIDLQQYRHVAAQGRDQLVRTVRVGFLCGTGHRASIVVTSERLHAKMQNLGSAAGGARYGATAYLLKTAELTVQEPELAYGRLSRAYAFRGREMPLRSIRLLTTTVPVVLPAANGPSWLMSPSGGPVIFEATATDVEGNVFAFELPLMFVPYRSMSLPPAQIAHAFRNPPSAVGSRAHTIELGTVDVAFAPAGERAGSTTVMASKVTYDVEVPVEGDPMGRLDASALPADYVPRFVPRIVSGTAVVPAVAELVGRVEAHAVRFDPLYLEHGFARGGNPGESFLRFTAPLDLAIPSQRGGGLARPNARADGLSRTLGPLASPAGLVSGVIDHSAFAGARLLGTVPLLDVIATGGTFDVAAAQEVPDDARLEDPGVRVDPPRLVKRRRGGADDLQVETRFVWKPPLRNHTIGILDLRFAGADLLLDARTVRSVSGTDATVTIGRLRGAALSFRGAIDVAFDELLFRAEEGKKIEVGATGVTLTFGGPLSFVNSLRSILPGFDDGPSVTVDSHGVVAGYTLGVPTVAVGIFSLQNIAVSAALSVPFAERPAGVRFGVSERHKPFLVTVSAFGGGGFFSLAVSANGLEQVEAAIEFGGSVALNLVIASGGVFVMAGVYFGLTGSSVTLTGYLRCGGSLEVLGLIAISVEFYLAFTYRKKTPGGSEVWGQASLVVSVKIAFFSKSVSLSVERRFAGSDGDPTFRDSITPGEWARYLQAFAR